MDSGPEQEITKKGVRLVFVSFSRICHFQKHPFRLYTGEIVTKLGPNTAFNERRAENV